MQDLFHRVQSVLGIIIVVSLVLCQPMKAYSETPRRCQPNEHSLVELLMSLYKQSENVKNSELLVKIAQEELKQANNERKPSINFTLSADVISENDNLRSFSDNFRSSSTQQLELSQPLWTGGRINAAVDFAKQNEKVERSKLNAIQSQTLLFGAEQLRILEVSRRRLEIRRDLVKSLENQVDLVETRFDLGQLTKTDLARARAQLVDAKRSVLQESYAMREAELAIQSLFNISLSGMKMIFSYTNEVINYGEATDIALSQNTDILVLDEQIELAKREVAVELKSLRPRLDLNVIGSARQYELLENSEDLSLVGTLSVPIYDKGQKKSKTRVAKLRLQQTRLSRDLRIREVRARVTALINSINEAKASSELADQVVGFETSAYEAAIEEQRLQRRSSFEVLALEQSLLSARVAQIDSNLNLVMSRVRLDAELGRLHKVLTETHQLCVSQNN